MLKKSKIKSILVDIAILLCIVMLQGVVSYLVISSLFSTLRPSPIESGNFIVLNENSYLEVYPQKLNQSFVVEAESDKFFRIGERYSEYDPGVGKFTLSFSSTEGGRYSLIEAEKKVNLTISFDSEEVKVTSHSPLLMESRWTYLIALGMAVPFAVLYGFLVDSVLYPSRTKEVEALAYLLYWVQKSLSEADDFSGYEDEEGEE